MSQLPRLAIGTVQPAADGRFLVWALLQLAVFRSMQPQHFHSRCCFFGINGALAASGEGSRHLDSWTMPESVAQELFSRAARDADLSVVEGVFDDCLVHRDSPGGSLDTLCNWLALPRIAIIDAPQVNSQGLPQRPQVEAILLDRFADADEYKRLSKKLGETWDLPVLGGLPELPRLREAVAELPPGSVLPLPLCAALGDALERYAKMPELLRLSSSRPWPQPNAEHDWDQTRRAIEARPITVAVAYDKVFHCHFLDTLDMLELLGATVVDFSPLQDEALPEDADLVYLGCGRPDHFAAQLAENVCLRMALHKHVGGGKRVYAEGGGLAYLAELATTPEGELPMTGLVPLRVKLSQPQQPLLPVELTLACDTWLGDRFLKLRGYRNPNLHFECTAGITSICHSADGECDLLSHNQVIGSRVHLNFAAQPRALCSLLAPRKYSMAPKA